MTTFIAADARVLGDESMTMVTIPALLTAHNNLARSGSQRKHTRLSHCRNRRVLGDYHRQTLVTINQLAVLFDLQDKYDAVEPLYATPSVMTTRIR